jgi:hypothetical protein
LYSLALGDLGHNARAEILLRQAISLGEKLIGSDYLQELLQVSFLNDLLARAGCSGDIAGVYS